MQTFKRRQTSTLEPKWICTDIEHDMKLWRTNIPASDCPMLDSSQAACLTTYPCLLPITSKRHGKSSTSIRGLVVAAVSTVAKCTSSTASQGNSSALASPVAGLKSWSTRRPFLTDIQAPVFCPIFHRLTTQVVGRWNLGSIYFSYILCF